MGIIDWIKQRTRRNVREVPGPAPEIVQPLEDVTLRTVRAIKQSSMPGYESRHGKARGSRYWHKHLSVAARHGKRTTRRIVRASKQANR